MLYLARIVPFRMNIMWFFLFENSAKIFLYANSRVSISLHNTRSKTTARISKIVAATQNVCAQPGSATTQSSLLENIFSPTFPPCTVYKVPTPTSSFSSGYLIVPIFVDGFTPSRPLFSSQSLRGLTYEFGSLSKFLFPLCKKVFRYLNWGSKVKRVMWLSTIYFISRWNI